MTASRTALLPPLESGPRWPRAHADHAGLHYNYACFAPSRRHRRRDVPPTSAVRRAAPAVPRDARRDDDFAAVRDDPRFEELSLSAPISTFDELRSGLPSPGPDPSGSSRTSAHAPIPGLAGAERPSKPPLSGVL